MTQITIDVVKFDGLFLKQEMGTGQIGGDPLTFGICLPSGVPYVHLRGEYYNAPEIFQLMLRAVHEQEGCEPEKKQRLCVLCKETPLPDDDGPDACGRCIMERQS